MVADATGRGCEAAEKMLLKAAAALAVLAWSGADAATKPRAVMIVPFDASALDPEERWLGEGIEEILALGLAQHAAFVQVDRARMRSVGRVEAWGEPVVVQTARTLHVDAALFGRVERKGTDYVIQPKAKTWAVVEVPLKDINAAGKTIDAIAFQGQASAYSPYYITRIQFE